MGISGIKILRIFMALLFSMFAVAASASEIVVSAASDLTGAFKEIGALYEKESGNKVIINFGSTGILAQQIEGGAPVDLFAAANRSYIDKLEKKGLILPDTKRLYAVGRITIATPKGEMKLNSLDELLGPGIKNISIANPAHAPYGMAAKEAMEKAEVWKKVKDRIVFGENIRQVLQYLETGSVDVAIIALSVSIGSDVNYTLIPQEFHLPIEQVMAVIKGSKKQKEAREFADFINGAKGRPIMKKYGFALLSEVE